MKMQIVTCPRCGTYLFDDTTECHGCGHILEQGAGELLKPRLLPTDSAVQQDMQACPNCGETCRTGLVRCWNCSSFLRADIEESYRRKRESGQYIVEHVELPILEATTITEEDAVQRRQLTPESFLESGSFSNEGFSGGDDFELSSEMQLSEADDDAFDLSEDLQLATESFSLAQDPVGLAPLATEAATDGDDLEVFRLQADNVESAAEPLPPLEDEPPAPGDSFEPPVSMETSEPPVRTTGDDAPPVSIEAPPEPEGEELLRIATDEEKEIQRVRKTMRSKDSFIIFCPQGCRIRVKEKHRGMKGKCPRCSSEFVVPKKVVAKKTNGATGTTTEQPVIASKYVKWLSNIRLHTVDPLKLRIKADSLLNECQPVDLGFSVEEVLIATLIAGRFGVNPKKVHPLRQSMIEHFLKGGTLDTLNVVAKKTYSRDLLSQLAVAQPTPAGTESLFANIPVFGVDRIAVRLPKQPDDTHSKYLSFCLSEFRAFAEGLQTVLGIEGLAKDSGIPMTDEYKTHKCHLSQAPVLELANANYYLKDTGFKLEVSGWKCGACGIVVGETARAAAKLGGANGKALPKTKCPKCSLKFGTLPPFYQLAGATAAKPQPAPAAETPAAAPAAT